MKSECKYSFLEAKSRLEYLCAYQERCSSELEEKMYDWGFNQEDTSQLISHLIAHNYLNEERFAEAFTSGKVNIKKWGRIKIHQQLKQKRISDYSIKKGLSSIDEVVYMENLQSLALKKWKSLSKERDSYSKKVKVYRFLSSKGYETDLLRNCVDEIAQ
tara:strand:+ start:5922 stop:6398 length:477 start_codon:yes stop_codon:yes gene_type:complete